MLNKSNNKKRIAVIGATGSVGSSVISVCRAHPSELEVCALAAQKDSVKLKSLAEEFHVASDRVCAYEKRGVEGLIEIANSPDIDHMVFASSGTEAIPALQAALRTSHEVSLANKESIVVAGPWVMPLLKNNDQLRPLDSEHNAIWQCLHGEKTGEKASDENGVNSGTGAVRKIYLTASGGPFRTWTIEQLRTVTPEMALCHPVWNMGAKITIDSATLMNKGIELIEAMFLFGLKPDQVGALISPGSFVHGLVEFQDGSVKMLAATPDMKLPAASCLFWPERRYPAPDFGAPVLTPRTIIFEEPDEFRFPALRIARGVMQQKGAAPSVLVGADEIAVDRFLKGTLSFTGISEVVEETLASCTLPNPDSLEAALATLDWARTRASEICDARAI